MAIARPVIHLQVMQLLQREVLERHLHHHFLLTPLLGNAGDQLEVVVDHRHQIFGDLHIELNHVSAVSHGVL